MRCPQHPQEEVDRDPGAGGGCTMLGEEVNIFGAIVFFLADKGVATSINCCVKIWQLLHELFKVWVIGKWR